MKIKDIFINTFLSFASIYIPLLFFSTLLSNINKNVSNASRKKELSERISFLNKGYLPNYIPNQLLNISNSSKI